MRSALKVAAVLGLFTLMLAFIACDGASGSSPTAPPASPGHTLPVATVTVEQDAKSEQLTVEIASKANERTQGLMFRQSLAEDAGMLFLFAGEQAGGFWMRNTYVPLSIAYLDANGVVVDIRDGRPLDESILTPSHPYRMVLEVNQGWFERHGMGIGATVRIPAGLPAPE